MLSVMVPDLIKNLDYLSIRLDYMKEQKEVLGMELGSIDLETKKLEDLVMIVGLSKQFYQKAVDILYEMSVGELKKIIDSALKYIFYDKEFKINIELEDKRGKSLKFSILDQTGEYLIEADVRNGIGAGVRTVISFIIHIFYLINKDSNILMLDEAYNFVSEEYRDNFFSFINQIAKEKGIIVIMISHLDFISSYTDKTYKITDGIVEELKG